MPKPKYISLPIYSIATFNEFFYISGGGGGKTGIKNQIFVFKHQITKEPLHRIQTGDRIIENMIVNSQKKILIASASHDIKIFSIQKNGQHLSEVSTFQADYAVKNSTLYSLCFHQKKNLLCTAGQDLNIRFYLLKNDFSLNSLYYSHSEHTNPLKNVDHNGQNLFLSCDTHEIILTDINAKKVIYKIYQDQLMPEKSLFQSANFIAPGSQELAICHYILRKAAYVTKTSKKWKKFDTAEITKDQSCTTAYQKEKQVLGIGCGNGSTYLVKVPNLETIGKEHNHGFVITGATMSRGGRFITGTPECSYNVQMIEQPVFGCSCFLPLVAIFTLLCIYLLGSQLLAGELNQSDL